MCSFVQFFKLFSKSLNFYTCLEDFRSSSILFQLDLKVNYSRDDNVIIFLELLKKIELLTKLDWRFTYKSIPFILISCLYFGISIFVGLFWKIWPHSKLVYSSTLIYYTKTKNARTQVRLNIYDMLERGFMYVYALSSELRFPKGAITAAAPEPRKRNPLPLLYSPRLMRIPLVWNSTSTIFRKKPQIFGKFQNCDEFFWRTACK